MNGTNIETDIYFKLTDLYLLLFSYPKHIKFSIPFNLTGRTRTIVSHRYLQNKRLRELKRALLERMYPSILTQNRMERPKAIWDVEEMRKAKKFRYTKHSTFRYSKQLLKYINLQHYLSEPRPKNENKMQPKSKKSYHRESTVNNYCIAYLYLSFLSYDIH